MGGGVGFDPYERPRTHSSSLPLNMTDIFGSVRVIKVSSERGLTTDEKSFRKLFQRSLCPGE